MIVIHIITSLIILYEGIRTAHPILRTNIAAIQSKYVANGNYSLVLN